WPIQDLPFRLVLFAHYNPVDKEAGFQPEVSDDGTRGPSGTDDLLLYQDVVEAVGVTLWAGARRESLGGRLRGVGRTPAGGVGPAGRGEPFFDPTGRRHRGTGEHVIYLRPDVFRGRLLPSATLEVEAVRPRGETVWSWETVRLLRLTYREAEAEGSG